MTLRVKNAIYLLPFIRYHILYDSRGRYSNEEIRKSLCNSRLEKQQKKLGFLEKFNSHHKPKCKKNLKNLKYPNFSITAPKW